MAVMLIESNDPKFSFHLKKNPASGLAMKKMRQGVITGWFPNGNTQQYALFFKDDTNNSSFSNEGKNFTDMTRYVSTYFVFYSISTMFSSVLKLNSEQESYIHKIDIPTVQLRSEKTIHHLNKFINLDLEVTKLSEDINSLALYSVNVSFEGTFNEFMMRTYILFYLLHGDMFQGDLQFMEGMIEKVTNILVELQAEYFLWYLFKKNIIHKPTTFDKLKDNLGKNSSDGIIEMKYGDTQQQRKQYIDYHVNFNNNIIDVGCGEGYYVLPYAKKMKSGKIYGIDKDVKLIENLNKKIVDRKQEDIVILHTDLNVFDGTIVSKNSTVLCVEVIEHMPYDDALDLVYKLLGYDFEKLIITTPNSEFNQFYKTLEGFRHDDHHFEFTPDEFGNFITSVLDKKWINSNGTKRFRINYEQVGDVVNGISMSHSYVITPTKEQQ